MKVKELIERLKRFDGELLVAPYMEHEDICKIYDMDVPQQVSFCRVIDGGIKFLSPSDPDVMQIVLLDLHEV